MLLCWYYKTGYSWFDRFFWFPRQAVLDDFDYSDEEDTLVQANRQLARQKERERDSVKPTPPLFPHTKYVDFIVHSTYISAIHYNYYYVVCSDSASPGNSSPRRQEPPPISEALFPPNDAHRFPPVDSAPPPPLVDPLNVRTPHAISPSCLSFHFLFHRTRVVSSRERWVESTRPSLPY